MEQSAPKTIKLTTAQALIKFLNQQYVEFDGRQHKFVEGIMTIFGHGNVLGIGQALQEDAGTLTVYQGCNEQGMAHIASGFAKQHKRKKILAVTSSVGPGAANMITAAATATANRIPLLLLPGDVYATRQPDPVLQQIEQPYDLSISTNDCFKPVSKYWDRINRPEQLMSAMINAMRVLTNPAETGAVTICLPQDVQAEAYDFPDYFFKKRIHRIERITPTLAMVEDLKFILCDKKKPLIICGGGVRYSEAHPNFKKLVERFQIPFAETQAGKGALEGDHPLNVGGIGTTGCLAANRIAREADLIIAIGTRFTDFTTASKSLFADKPIVMINISPFDAQKMDAIGIVSDALIGIDILENLLNEIDFTPVESYLCAISDAQLAWQQERNRLFNLQITDHFKPEVCGHLPDDLMEYRKSLKTELCQTRVLGLLDRYLEDDAIVIGAAGSLPGDLQRLWQPKKPDTYHMEYGYSCMGYEIAAAVGAKIASPNQPVYSFVGDGSYMMLHSELHTAIQEGLKITVLLFDNASFGCINNLQMGNGMPSYITENRFRDNQTKQLSGNLIPVDFAQNAASYGCKTYRVNNEEDLIHAIEDAKLQTVPVLIDIKVLPKTMTSDYEAWWRVGVAEVANNKAVNDAASKNKHVLINQARQY